MLNTEDYCIYDGKTEANTICWKCTDPLCQHCGYSVEGRNYCNHCYQVKVLCPQGNHGQVEDAGDDEHPIPFCVDCGKGDSLLTDIYFDGKALGGLPF